MNLLLCCALVGVAPQGPLKAAEAALLLRCGVSEDEVLAASSRLGGCVARDEADVRELRAAGATEALVDRLVVAEPVLRRLARLSGRFDAARADALGLAFLSPKGWRIDRSAVGEDGGTVRTGASEGAPGAAPRALFAFVRERTGLSGRATAAVAEAASRIIADRLEGADLKPRSLERTVVDVMGAPAELFRLAGARGDEAFEVAVAVRVDADGRLVGAGYLAPAAAREEVRELFEDFAATLALDRR